MEKVKGCFDLLPSQVAHAVLHYVLRVDLAVSAEDIVLVGNLLVLLCYVSDLHYILADKLIRLVHDLGKPLLAKAEPFELHLFDPRLAQHLISDIGKTGAGLNYQPFRIFFEGPVGLLALNHQILMLEDEICKLPFTQRFLVDLHVSDPI